MILPLWGLGTTSQSGEMLNKVSADSTIAGTTNLSAGEMPNNEASPTLPPPANDFIQWWKSVLDESDEMETSCPVSGKENGLAIEEMQPTTEDANTALETGQH
uniref:Uncharacterized protein n=1 Tax=Nelumbo nucifera TaxID=4432 RepID=A0A822YWF7_NELNU|nr:TPA_asm: hypothetical protein HUJ06_006329 [Nelumbo nucifera]